MIKEHARVVLTKPLLGPELRAGDVGTEVRVYEGSSAYEVDFFRLDGRAGAGEVGIGRAAV